VAATSPAVAKATPSALSAAARPDLLLDVGNQIAQMVIEIEVVSLEHPRAEPGSRALRPRRHLRSGRYFVVISVERMDRAGHRHLRGAVVVRDRLQPPQSGQDRRREFR